MKGKDTKPDVHQTHTSIVLCHEKKEKKKKMRRELHRHTRIYVHT